jgi:hypothetical protein
LLIKKQAGFWTLPKGWVIPDEALVEASESRLRASEPTCDAKDGFVTLEGASL